MTGRDDMDTLAIEHEIFIDAPIEVVWRTVTEPDQIVQWFTDLAELDLQPGGDGNLTWEDKATTHAMTSKLVVQTVEPPTRFSFRWNHPDGVSPADGNSMLVEFTLAAEGPERTHLRVVETGLETIDWPDAEKGRYADEHRHGWSVHLGSLVSLLGDRSRPGPR
jgi:uncharacterized protein YndB with AHSA1/START domain